MSTYEKLTESSMSVVKEAPVVEPITTTYTIDFLKQQELDILKSMNDFIAKRQVELDEVRALIAEADNLGLKTKEVLQAEAIDAEQAKLEELPTETINPIKN
jgi:hypothetical protein